MYSERPTCGSRVRRRSISSVGLILVVFATVAICSAQEQQRKALDMPTPLYPEIARRMNLTGTVRIKVTVSPDGRVRRADVIGGHPLLAEAAIEACKRWKYEPGKTETEAQLEFHFHP